MVSRRGLGWHWGSYFEVVPKMFRCGREVAKVVDWVVKTLHSMCLRILHIESGPLLRKIIS